MGNWHEVAVFWMTSAFLFFFGSTIGSFLNVVIYRLPMGLNLGNPGSRCPFCEHPIRARDNVPVFGWLNLRGRCRDCGAPIPVRYPAVELVMGLLVLGLGHWELLSGGANLPIPGQRIFVDPLYWYATWPITGIFIYHCTLLSCLLAAVMIRYDGHPLPKKLIASTFALGLLPPLVDPVLHPVPFLYPFFQTSMLLVWRGGPDGLLGWATGGLLGCWLQWAVWKEPRRGGNDQVFFLSACGIYLGWQAALAVALATAMVSWFASLTGKWTRTTVAAIPAALIFLFLTFWKQWWSLQWLPGHSSRPWATLSGVVALFAVGVLLRCQRVPADGSDSLNDS